MKSVYYFGKNNSDGQADMKNLLGGKGANLAEMAKLGIPVPAGLTITTDVCTYYYENNQTFPTKLEEELKQALQKVESGRLASCRGFSYTNAATRLAS